MTNRNYDFQFILKITLASEDSEKIKIKRERFLSIIFVDPRRANQAYYLYDGLFNIHIRILSIRISSNRQSKTVKTVIGVESQERDCLAT